MDIVTSLIETRNYTITYFDLPLTELLRTYVSGKWGIKKIPVHLADAESVLHERIKSSSKKRRTALITTEK